MNSGGNGGKGGRGSGISDLLLWKAFTRDVRPLEEEPDWSELEEQALKEDQKPKPSAGREKIPVKREESKQKPSSYEPAQLDRRTEERFRKGKLPIEGRLDLHGFTQDEAHMALTNFIQSAYAAGKRCVIVITGKGTPRSRAEEEAQRGEGTRRGILRQRVPDWLSAPPLSGIVLKVTGAQPKDGGNGAFYVYLKRQR